MLKVMKKRPESPTHSCVSMRSDRSKDRPPEFKEPEPLPELSAMEERSESPTHSCVSMRSDRSKDRPPEFKEAEPPPELSAMRSDRSKDRPSEFKEAEPPPELSAMRSDRSKDRPLEFKEAEPPPELSTTVKKHCCVNKECQGMKDLAHRKKFQENVFHTFKELENKVIAFMKHELKRFKQLLKKENTTYYDKGEDDNYSAREGALNITVHFLRKMNQKNLADSLEKCPIELCQRKLKSNLKKRYGRVLQGIAQQGKSELLEKIYTDLYITEGGSGAVNKDHEVGCIEKATRSQEAEEKLIECNKIFQPLPEEDRPIRTVLTKGVAGIGKSISVQKFILDWAKGNENQDIELIFPLPFRELNLKKEKYSFMEILHQFFPETKGLMFTKSKDYKVLFIFDGLDECRHPLEFKKNEIWSDLTTRTSLDVLLTNLIKGNLFPSALIWITSRPAAASHIPPECIDLVAEVRGFNEDQKEEYFRKKIEDKTLAERVIKLIKESRSLFIMCHIPVFCWISATVFERILMETDAAESAKEPEEKILKTLTQMYAHFLIFQTKRKTEKYDDKSSLDTQWDEKGTQAMGQLAFQNLLKNNLIFCASDLKECGISVEDASVYSGMCTQIFKEDSGIFCGTAFCFVHLSIQEFMAALYAHMCMNQDKRNVFADQDTSPEINTMTEMLKNAVDKALKSDSGLFDLFLRFILGLSLQSNQKLLHGLLTHSESSSQSKEEIVTYIKDKFKENPSAERSINLFHCLNELNDKSLVEDIQKHLKSGSLSSAKLSPAQWSALVFVLLTSEEVIEEFDLKKFQRSDECLKRLLPVVRTATKALLNNCCLTQESCSAIAKILSSSSLKELDLSDNDIKDSGVEFLAGQLENPQCKLETLRLSNGNITGKGYSALALALGKNLCLKELDLRGNDPGDSGVKSLTNLKEYSTCKLDTVRLLKSDAAEKACAYLTSVLGRNPLLLTELDLSEKKPGDSGVKQFCALLKDSHCRFKKLKLSDCSMSKEGCAALTKALTSNPSHLRELDLSDNKLGNSGVKHISDLLKCNLENPELLKSDAAEKACAYLTSVLHRNPLLLTELDLSEKKPGDSGVKQFCALLEDSHCRFKKLKLSNSSITEEGCPALTSALISNPSHLIQLNLSDNELRDSGVKQISTLLRNPDCKLQRLELSNCGVTGEGYAALASALKSNPSHLEELDLRGNDPGDSGVELLTSVLNNKKCKLRLLKSDAAEKACVYLTSVLGRNPLLLTELDLSEKKPGDSGVKQFCALLEDSHCRFKKLKLLKSDAAEKACAYLTSVLHRNPLLLTELDLSEKKPGDSGVKQFCALLEDSHCRLKKLNLSDCGVTGEGYAALASALKSNPSHLEELDLRGNEPGDSGVELLTSVLKNQKCKLR
ncbi:hypothetical protein ACEWY4_026580 [Coilia grayii]|uniref:NACHT domain-containing protein n=1 Tax=Coilia grayii TaxID=363190 RepID=A0ABD1ISZ7_9TELE